jgi:hypothetical protein
MDALEWLWRQGNQVVSELSLFSGAVKDFRLGENEDAETEIGIYQGDDGASPLGVLGLLLDVDAAAPDDLD